MNYFNLIDGLRKEAFEFTQYKKVSLLYKILLTVCMLPVILADIALFVFYEILAFFHKGLSTPIDVLHGFVKKERDEVKHLTQAVVYAITLPWIFFNYVLLSLVSFLFYFVWFFIMICTYVITLGGVRWQPFVSEATYPSKTKFKYLRSGKTISRFSIVACIAFVLTIVFYLCLMEEPSDMLNDFYSISAFVYTVLIFIVNPILFRKVPLTEEQNDALEVVEATTSDEN